MCNECLTPKTAFRPVSIQVQFPNHQCQTQAGSHWLLCQHGHNCSQTINAKPMGTISWASMSTWTQAGKLLMPNQ